MVYNPVQSSRAHTRSLLKLAAYSTAFIVMSLVSFLASMSYLTVQPLKFTAPDNDEGTAEVSLIAELLSIDPISRTITMDWYPSFAGADCTARDPLVLDVFLSQSLLEFTRASWTTQPPLLPLSRLNSSIYCSDPLVEKIPSPFRTVTNLIASATMRSLITPSGHSNLQDYPFDAYIAPFLFFTRNINTGAIVSPNVTNSLGVAVNFEMSLKKSVVFRYEVGNVHASSLHLAFEIKRSNATKMYIILIQPLVITGLTAAVFLIICAATMVYRPHQIYSEIFVVPIGALFAFSSIRANLPGAPAGFGTTLDMYSTLPVLMIMSFCSVALLLVILYRRICDASSLSDQRENTHHCGTLDIECESSANAIAVPTEVSSIDRIKIEEDPDILKDVSVDHRY